jgi:hypothetical protein
MATGLLSKALAVATLAAGTVWLLTVATFDRDPYVDNRPYCSGSVALPYTVGGVRVEPTIPPHCRFGPIPADALGPSAVPAVATFLLVGSLGLLVVGFMVSNRPSGDD